MSESPVPKLDYAAPASNEEVYLKRYARRANWCVLCGLLIWGMIATAYFWPRQPPRPGQPGDFGDGWIIDISVLLGIPILILVGSLHGFIATRSSQKQVRRRAYFGMLMCLSPVVLLMHGIV